MEIKKHILLPFLLFYNLISAQKSDSLSWTSEISTLQNNPEVLFIKTQSLFNENWHALPQTTFWKKIISLPPDSCILNTAESRQILLNYDFTLWTLKTETEKKLFKDSLKHLFHLDTFSRILVTHGKMDFYKLKEVFPTISAGIKVFSKIGVDPWYAQAILLIESPAQLKKSISGAYGAFQLMPGVAKSVGLIVTNTIDERENFEKSAFGAATLINRICLPSARRILNSHNILFSENELWFRLFVMHIYHAGAGNVAAVTNKINPKKGGQSLIQEIWKTNAGSFGNSSQNYSQVLLATQVALHEYILSLD